MTGANRKDIQQAKRQRAVKLDKQGLNAKEIAERIGSTPGSVYSMLRVAKSKVGEEQA